MIHTLAFRRAKAVALLRLGLTVSATARLANEDRRQIVRWKNKLSHPPISAEADKHSVSGFSPPQIVTPPQGMFEYFNDNGEREAAVFTHPIDELEPAPAAPPLTAVEERSNRIRRVALRYLLLQESRPMRVVAAEIGCTPAGISRVLVELSDKLGFKSPVQKSADARAAYVERQRAVRARR